jgi:hypothetical protein
LICKAAGTTAAAVPVRTVPVTLAGALESASATGSREELKLKA